MADGNWEDILNTYKREYDSEKSPWAKELIWMEKLIKHLLSNRDLSELYPITSHFNFLLKIGKSLKDCRGKNAVIKIRLNTDNTTNEDEYRYEFQLIERFNETEIFRKKTETVLCSFEKSLDIFDEMYEKLKSVS